MPWLRQPSCPCRLKSNLAGHWYLRMPPQDRLSASLRFSFPSAFTDRGSLLVQGCQPCQTHPASAFDYAPAVLGATPLRRRLTSFAPATVDRSQSCITGLFLGDVPLLARRWPRSRRPPRVMFQGRPADNAHGIQQTLRSFVPALQGNHRSSRQFEPRVSFDERPPRRFLCGGSIAKSVFRSNADRSRDVHFDFRD